MYGIIKFFRLFTGYLSNVGYFKSLYNKNFYINNEVPWWTFSSWEYLKRRDMSHLVVLEFGAGASSKFLSNRVKYITSFETEIAWADNIIEYFNKKNIKNARVEYVSDEDIETTLRNNRKLIQETDLVIIDGYDRNLVLSLVIDNLSETSIVLFDDFDRVQYSISRSLLEKKGFKVLEFWGLSFGSVNLNCTAVFYKANNCLNI